MTSMSTTERTAEIRKALKAAGWTSRDVSVRAANYSMGATIHVTIKNAAVPVAICERAARRFETVDRCELTGEILSGGNTYLDIEYSRELMAELIAGVVPQVPEKAGSFATVEGWDVSRDSDSDHYYSASRQGFRRIHCWGREFCARQIVTENLARAHKPRVHVVADCVEVAS